MGLFARLRLLLVFPLWLEFFEAESSEAWLKWAEKQRAYREAHKGELAEKQKRVEA